MNSYDSDEPSPLGSAPGDGRRPDLERLSRLVADGALPMPADLSPADLRTLVARVRHARRDKLLDHIAWAIALDIRRARLKEIFHAEEPV